MNSHYSILEHPADIGIEAHGKNLKEAFRHAAVALMSVIVDLSNVEARESREVELSSNDFEQLLVNWLAEVLYYYDGQHFVGKEFTIKRFSSYKLTATIKGEPFSDTKHRSKLDVKAITYHQIVVREDNQGGYVKVFVDI
ncbi:MAG: archease [Ignavibacteriae bacterium]|nr:archease [Ignavibacteriota bacterium]